jgi:hypothetical protein
MLFQLTGLPRHVCYAIRRMKVRIAECRSVCGYSRLTRMLLDTRVVQMETRSDEFPWENKLRQAVNARH